MFVHNTVSALHYIACNTIERCNFANFHCELQVFSATCYTFVEVVCIVVQLPYRLTTLWADTKYKAIQILHLEFFKMHNLNNFVLRICSQLRYCMRTLLVAQFWYCLVYYRIWDTLQRHPVLSWLFTRLDYHPIVTHLRTYLLTYCNLWVLTLLRKLCMQFLVHHFPVLHFQRPRPENWYPGCCAIKSLNLNWI